MAARPARPAMGPAALTARHLQVLHCYALGHQQAWIATELGVSVNTIKSATSEIYQRLGADNNCNAVALAIALELLPYNVATLPFGGQ
jgi:DNA-binding NarL/FixJ family response regulator